MKNTSGSSGMRSTVAACAFGLMLALGLGYGGDAHAQREVRGGARTSVNHNVAANRNVNVNENRNVNVNANVNRNVVVAGRPGYNNDYHPVATAAAVTATAAVTAAAIGSMTRTLPPSCAMTVVNGITSQNCGGTWYQPQYAGSQVTYVVVTPPG